MIDSEFLAMLACPSTRQPLRPATAAELAALNAAARSGGLCNRGGAVVAPLAAALATADGAWFYPVEDGIPRLLVTAAIPGAPATDGAGR